MKIQEKVRGTEPAMFSSYCHKCYTSSVLSLVLVELLHITIPSVHVVMEVSHSEQAKMLSTPYVNYRTRCFQ